LYWNLQDFYEGGGRLVVQGHEPIESLHRRSRSIHVKLI
jgi:hypothetical protein